MAPTWDVFRADALAGRRALVTGAGRGVGRQLAAALATAGAHVTLNDVALDRARSAAADLGNDAVGAAADVTDRASVSAMLDAHGPWDIVVNNAGNAGASASLSLVPFETTEPESWDAPLAVNLAGVMNVTHAALPHMTAQGWGRIITVVSDAGRVGDPGLAAYAAAKAGAAGFMRSIARETGKFGVCVNCVSLGSIVDPERDQRPAAVIEAQARRYPVRRLGAPQDVAGLVVLLATDAGAWITGQTIPVNGGYSSAL